MKKDLLNFILTLIIVFLCSLSGIGKEIEIKKVCELQKNYNIDKRDTSLLISFQLPFIKIGNKTYVGEQRKTWYSVEDYIVYDEFKIKNGKITFEYNPDTSKILQVTFEEKKTFYYRP